MIIYFISLKESRDVKVVRCYVGHFMTSLEMRGVQLSMLRVDEDVRSWWLDLLDAPTSAPAWPKSVFVGRHNPDKIDDEEFKFHAHFEVTRVVYIQITMIQLF